MRVLACIAALLLIAPAQAQDTGAPAADGAATYVVGVFTPRVLFANSLARQRYAEGIAQALQTATGAPFRGRGFATAGEFANQVGAGAVDFAVVEAQYQIEKGYPALAQATAGGAAAQPMVLAVGGGKGENIGELQGKSLATVSVGPGDRAFVTNFLLQGQVEPDYFKKGKGARDVQGALTLVSLGKADATFTYAGQTAGLGTAFRSRPAPLPVFVQTDPSVPGEVAGTVRKAIIGVRAPGGLLDGFAAYDSKPHGALRGALKAAPARPGGTPVTSPVRAALPTVEPHLSLSGEPPVVLPDPAADLTVPPPPADQF